MEITTTVFLSEQELKEAVVLYINNCKSSNCENVSNLVFVNGTLKENACITGIEVNIS